jgi:hypothetical protein
LKETKAISQLAAEQDLHPKESRRVPRARSGARLCPTRYSSPAIWRRQRSAS